MKPAQVAHIKTTRKATRTGGLKPMAGMMLPSLAMPIRSKLFGSGLESGGQLNPMQIGLLNSLTPEQFHYLQGNGARLPGTRDKGARFPGTRGIGARLPGTKGKRTKRRNPHMVTEVVRGGFKLLTNNEIEEIMRKYNITNYRGCYLKDILPFPPLE